MEISTCDDFLNQKNNLFILKNHLSEDNILKRITKKKFKRNKKSQNNT